MARPGSVWFSQCNRRCPGGRLRDRLSVYCTECPHIVINPRENVSGHFNDLTVFPSSSGITISGSGSNVVQPTQRLLNLKLERVQELLRNPSISVIDIALDCGFSS